MGLEKISKEYYDELFEKTLKSLEEKIILAMADYVETPNPDLVSLMETYSNLLLQQRKYRRDFKKYRIYHYLQDKKYLYYKRGTLKKIGFRQDKDEPEE